jgi:peptidoglycan/LPS O-acetylase OafA/YrhL
LARTAWPGTCALRLRLLFTPNLTMTHAPPHGKAPILSHMAYRPDIDGLRAIAVLSVLVFHAFPNQLPGGFIGVDIFFVISGFLISSIIFSNLEQNHFSIIEFYDRRIRRIFPSLVTVMLATLGFGWFFLLADELQQLGKHIAAGSGFISNFVLWGESGYFDNAADTKPMLHLWSLAIEEQFYIFWPLLMALVWRRHWSFLSITAVVGVLSFAANLYWLAHNPTSAFYLPLARFWELMIGGVLAYLNLHRPPHYRPWPQMQGWLGLALLAAGFMLINRNRAFPGFWAILPALGAFLLISANGGSWVNQKILSHPLMVWFGKISYPLYLWHWPLLSLARVMDELQSAAGRVLLLLASVALAWLTVQLIEKPLRFRRAGSTPWFLLGALLLTGCLGYSCVIWRGYEGHALRDAEKTGFADYFENSLPNWRYFEREQIPTLFRDECNFYNIALYRQGKATPLPRDSIATTCYVRQSGTQHAVLLWGDSHAAQLSPGLMAHLPHDWQLLQITSSDCRPDSRVTQDSNLQYCQRSNWFAMQTIKQQRPDVVVVAQNLGHDAAKMAQIAADLRALGVARVIFTGPTPHWRSHLPKIILRKLWHNTPERTWFGADPAVIQSNLALKRQFVATPGAQLVNLIDYFCNQEGCPTRIGPDRKTGISSWDYGHLTPAASGLLAREVLVPLIVQAQGAKP